MIQINVETRRATVTEKELLTTQSAGIQVQFNFSADWDDLARVAVFRLGEDGTAYKIILDSSNLVEIPQICLTESDEPLFVGAYGTDGNATVIIPTIWVSAGVVRPGTGDEVSEDMPPEPDSYWAQVLGLANSANDTANNALEVAGEANATAQNALTQVSAALDETAGDRAAAQEARVAAEEARDDSIDASILSRSWAVGNTGSREDEDANNAMYWAGQAEATVEAAVGDIEDARDDAIADVQAEGTTQIGLVGAAGTTQIGNVNSAGSTQISAVQGEGATQIAAVQAEGTAQQALLQPYVTAASGYADAASTSASSASGSATSASASATSAGASKTAAETAQTAAEAAQTAAETAQGKAEDAQDAAEDAQAAAEAAAESISESAAQIATNTENIAQNTSDIATNASAIAENTSDIADLETAKAPVIIDTASGSIASFSDGADGMPVKSIVCQINPQQDLHGQANPYPAGGGKNLLPQPQSYSDNGLTVTPNSDGSITIAGTATGTGGYITDSINLAKTIPSGTAFAISTTNNIPERIRIFIDTGSIDINAGANNAVRTFNYDVTWVRFYLSTTSNTQYNFTIFPMVEIGSAATSFAPYSNTCPIGGWTGLSLTRDGANILDPVAVFGDAPTQYTVNQDGSITVNATDGRAWSLVSPIPIKKGTYTLSRTTANGWVDIRLSTENYSVNHQMNTTMLSVTFTIAEDGYYKVKFGYSASSYPFTSEVQLEPGTTASPYKPFVGEVIPITWQTEAGTVYGGSLNVTTGVLTVEKAYSLLNDKTKWKTYSGGNVNYIYDYQITPRKIYSDSYTGLMCSAVSVKSTSSLRGRWRGADSTYFGIYDGSNVLTLEKIQEMAENNQIAICYDIEPITVQLDPITISTLYGQNNIFADCGDVSVDYPCDTKLYIDRPTEPAEDDMIADSLIASGKYFFVNNRLFLSTASIAVGAMIIPGSNCVETSIAEALNTLNS